MCYNQRAVEPAVKQALVASKPEAVMAPTVAATSDAAASVASRGEDPSRFCPVCSQRLESRRCKLMCSVCGYYMSCADYY